MTNQEKILNELINKQRKHIPKTKKLQYNDLLRMSKYLKSSIHGDECTLWTGYNEPLKHKHVLFYFNKKKQALHRLLYINFVDDLTENEYLMYSCYNRKCCNVDHMNKYKYYTKTPEVEPKQEAKPRIQTVNEIVLIFD